MNRKEYITPRCEAMSLAAPRLLDGSDPVAEDRLRLGFDNNTEAWEDAY